MAVEFKLPELGENIEAGTVLDVLVRPGDHVERDQTVVELETDKATTEVPVSFSGTVRDILVREGDEIQSGQAILMLEEDGAEAPAPAKERAPVASKEGEVAGDAVPVEQGEAPEPAAVGEQRAGEAPATPGPETRVAAQPTGEAPAARGVEQPTGEAPAAPGVEQPTGEALATRGVEQPTREALETGSGREAAEQVREPGVSEHPARQAREPAPTAPRPGGVRPGVAVSAAPNVRQLARELGVALADVAATGPAGEVTEDDVKSHVRALLERYADRLVGPAEPQLPDLSRWGPVERKAMSNVRRATARQVATAWQQPHVTQFDNADITDLEAFRQRYSNASLNGAAAKLTLTAILVKVCGEALPRFPALNASVDGWSQEIVLRRYVSISVAVDTAAGLLVPVIRDVPNKGLLAVANELAELADAARRRKLSAEQMDGGTFSVTNLGGLGTTQFTPILTWPQVAIVGVGRASVQPVMLDGTWQPRRILPLGITYDHRAVDGADAARFLRWVADVLESPWHLMLEPSVAEPRPAQ